MNNSSSDQSESETGKEYIDTSREPWSQSLIESNSDIDLKKQHKRPEPPELHRAIMEEDIEKASDLLARGTDINMRDDMNNTALHVAALSCSLKMVNYLINKGADLNARGMLEETPLLILLRGAEDETSQNIVRLLIEKGSDLTVRAFTGEETLLHMAAECKLTGIAKLLIEKGAALDDLDSMKNTPPSLCCQERIR